MRTFIIQSEADTLQRIAAKRYADWTLWPAIRDASAYLAADYGADWWIDPPIGQVVTTPDLPNRASRYVVLTTDTWESISDRFYGTEAFSDRIRARNGGGSIVDLAGQQVTIPALISPDRIGQLETGN